MSEDATSNEETLEVETEEQEATVDVLESLGEDDLRKEVKKLRREAAKHRTAKQAKDSELEEFKAWKESQLTELEKAQKRASELEGELGSLKREREQRDAAKKAGLDVELADRVRGDTFDEMVEDAKRLSELFPKSSVVVNSVKSAQKPVGAKRDDAKDWFNNLLNGK